MVVSSTPMVFDRITTDPEVMSGQPCVKGTRLTVRRVLAIVGEYTSREAIRADYPQLEDEDIRQALGYAAATLEDRIVPLKDAS